MTNLTPVKTPEALAVQQLVEIVSANAKFQEINAAYSDAEAAEIVFDGGEVVAGSSPKCSAVIYDIAGEPPQVIAAGVVMPAGQIALDIWLAIENTDDMRGEYLRINNLYASIGRDINNYGPSGYVMTATKSGPAQRSHPAHIPAVQPDQAFWFVQYMVRWGPFR